jgi:hypothetical protein
MHHPGEPAEQSPRVTNEQPDQQRQPTRRRVLRTGMRVGVATAVGLAAASYIKPSFESLGTPSALAWSSTRPPAVSVSPSPEPRRP